MYSAFFTEVLLLNELRQNWSPELFRDFHHGAHDACGIVASIEKNKLPTRENIERCIDALVTMDHRAGFINGEGDGAGIHIDIPRAVWSEKLEAASIDPSLALSPRFIIGHFFIKGIPVNQGKQEIVAKLEKQGLQVVLTTLDSTRPETLGPIAAQENPHFLQTALLAPEELERAEIYQSLFDLQNSIEENSAVHAASLSPDHVVYKVMGAGASLREYYKDLTHPKIASTMTLGHNRYSTNTLSNFFRVQPFSVIGHNGEINTISKLRAEAKKIDVPLVENGSDSQDLNRTIETLIGRDGYSLFEAMELVFPPIINEIKQYPDHLQDLYAYLRETWGHFAQGPAGIVSRFGEEAVFSVDSLGLRPLWMLEVESAYVFASEPGIINSSEFTADPKPLSPGEKIGFAWDNDTIKKYEYTDFQNEIHSRFETRIAFKGYKSRLETLNLPKNIMMSYPTSIENGQYNAFGWEREQVQLLEQMAEKGAEPIRSLGHDSPLAAINPNRKNVTDFIKESVAVVTNPAIDRDRETEHFSTRTIIGKRPHYNSRTEESLAVELLTPLVIEGKAGWQAAETLQQPSYDGLVHLFQSDNLCHFISITFSEEETIPAALERLADEAAEAVSSGKTLLVLDDGDSHHDGKLWLDPHLALAAVDQRLTNDSLRRDCSLLLRSAAIRSLHDVIVAYGFGADAISPYYMFLTVMEEESNEPVLNLYTSLQKGLEKVISTIGIHELRGYGRLFSSIGLSEEVARTLDIVNFFGAEGLAFNFEEMKKDSIQRAADYFDEKQRISKSFHLFPRIWKAIGDVARTGDYTGYREKITEQEETKPVTIRHLTSLKKSDNPIDPEKVDISVGSHSLPFAIASMSFGSQNEIAFRAYAEAADRLNMVSLNGEGGEIKDMIGKYPNSRGQQIASGRFGVNAELLNSSNLLEIKIGQGAKPGEGGHLPGSKVTAKIAQARNATIGSDLISPSNNHDIYSIEDLAQMIHELKTANDQAKVAVKVPVVPNIGTIAVGIAKAGADIVTLSGFDGGTGAARIHALQHVGLPVEIGVKAAHNALLEAGLRDTVEIWADGGIKSMQDVMKVMLLGANRIGFGTLSMIAIGCTTCRGCHLDTCHVGIATQIESEAQAKDHGLRRFVPRQLDLAVSGLTNLFTAFGEELKSLAASIGIQNLQDAVGRSDLLEQVRGNESMNLSTLLQPLEIGQLHKEAAASLEQPRLLQAVSGEYLDSSVEELHLSREFSGVISNQRVLGSRASGHRVRSKLKNANSDLQPVQLSYKDCSIPGNGLGAYNVDGINITVSGGAQDGLGKSSYGGSIVVTKGRTKNDLFFNGSAGKGFGYGAQEGLLMVQGNADARAGIRLSGADMVIGGQVTKPIPAREHGNLGANANIKGFAFEYMTNGRGLVLGDPGPWICAGMTGGVVYLRHQPEMGLTKEAITRRIAKGAKVQLQSLNEQGVADVTELLSKYIKTLETEQPQEAEGLRKLLESPGKHFLQVIPSKEQADPSVSTE
ncbi:glutamate synthase [Rossellomorea vietnamensis]|uniref:Glutamate synthase n=1 Tax=Rossellomorea vietnamensis TaxID=218284 RepID=A0A5D4KEY7_9BACI|nr:glutamate synthase-related protein [Rossellomorea vietnamensis]TYR75857.1 glutamate synthase [Rossellomorea vietnamensis]